MARGKIAKLNRRIARKTKKRNSNKDDETYKNVTEAREYGIELPNQAERIKRRSERLS